MPAKVDGGLAEVNGNLRTEMSNNLRLMRLGHRHPQANAGVLS